LPAGGVTAVTIGAVLAIILVGRFATGPAYHAIASTRLRELNTAFALFIVIAIAVLMTLVGLSPALGAFVAGVVLANSEFRHELESDIEPFKGLLLGLFFLTVGAGIDFAVFLGAPAYFVSLTIAVIAIKGAILYGLASLFGLRGTHRWLVTLSLAQAGEFGFVLVSFGVAQGVLGGLLGQQLLLIVALSMLVTPLLFILHDTLTRRLDAGGAQDEDTVEAGGPIIVVGIGRFGQVVNRMVETAGFKTVVLDNNLATVQLMRTFGFKGYYGDPTRPDLLHAAGIDGARVLVVALDDAAASVKLVAYARRVRPDIQIIARARDRAHVYELVQAGADEVVREMFDSSLRAGRYVIEQLGVSEFDAFEIEERFFRHDRHALKELAALWDPKVPI
ncbi:MAG: NAD-binding protein, partial [Pseudomonadota bacterium]